MARKSDPPTKRKSARPSNKGKPPAPRQRTPKAPAASSAPEAVAQSAPRAADALAPFADLLLPYQVEYLKDRSQLKKLLKSRRIGGTWVQSLEDVLDCIERPGLKVWFSSSDLSAAVEYIDYVKMWTDVASLIVQTIVVAEDSIGSGDQAPDAFEVAAPGDATATMVLFHNGSKITALSSRPGAFRSKGGKVVLDELAYHNADRDLWKAAQPVAGAWGYPIRILSTENGKGTVFHQLGNPEFETRHGDEDDEDLLGSGWSVHEITIERAVAEGMYDRVMGRPTTEQERRLYIRKLERQCLSKAAFREEFMCQAQDEAHALLTYEMIRAVERKDLPGIDAATGMLYLGMDVARKRDLTVIYVMELVGRDLVRRAFVEMHKTKFSAQKAVLWPLLRHPRLARALIDATGIGAQMAEEAQDDFGSWLVEAVTFTASVKDHLATRLVQEFQDSTLLIDDDPKQREGLHAVRKIVTGTNAVRYDAEHDSVNGHADHFWALALAVSAARSGSEGDARIHSSMPSGGSGGSGICAGMIGGSRQEFESWVKMR